MACFRKILRKMEHGLTELKRVEEELLKLPIEFKD